MIIIVWLICHDTGKYRGAAHSICNSKFNVPNDKLGKLIHRKLRIW